MAKRPVSVIEFAGYRRRDGELMSAAQRDAVIDLVAYEPTCGDIIPGSGGLRKVRIGRDGIGKRGGESHLLFLQHGFSNPAACTLCEKRKRRFDGC